MVDAGNGWSKIINVHSGKLRDQSLDDGAQVTQWTDNGTSGAFYEHSLENRVNSRRRAKGC